MSTDVVVVGSGLAGSASAIHLARAGWTVDLIEKRDLPAHKLCGEFLSPEVQRAFRALGVLPDIQAAGAVSIDRALLTATRGTQFRHALPGTALGLSRYVLDLLLLSAAERAGVRVHRGVSAKDVEGGLERGFTVQTSAERIQARAVIGAWGRSSRLDRRMGRDDLGRLAPWVAFKAHYTGLRLGDVIELHLFPGGYCGMSEVEDGRVNVCWIVHRDALLSAGGKPESLITSTLTANPMLAERFASLDRIMDPFLSASQLRFHPRATFLGDVCLVGDAAGMIAPLCGDGMAMALDGADLAARELDRYLTGGDAGTFRRRYDHDWHRAFGRRMRVGRWLHTLFVNAEAASAGLSLARTFPRLGGRLIRATRGS